VLLASLSLTVAQRLTIVRINRIVYAVFAFQFNLTSLVIFVSPDNLVVQKCLGTSVVIYNTTVFALAVVTGCSLPCVLRCCRWCLPTDSKRTPKLPDGSDAYYACSSPMPDNAAPTSWPVFVFTDIESSSALWAIDDGRVMQKAVQIHDDILRAALTQHRGYEITTAGDAFQLAFHTIREAATYCLDVQTQLLTAKWPKELHGLVPATTKERHAHRYVFRGLRVRMGIHDAAECEGRLVVDVHAVTGKTTYTGTSEAIASTVGDLGAGGQIVVTRRVAEWLEQNRELVVERFEIAWLSDLVVPQVNVHVVLSQLLPAKLAARKRLFGRFNPASRLQQSTLRAPSVSRMSLREALVPTSQCSWQPLMRVERLSAAAMV
jgi:class 3 adenylate cyclase